MESMADLKVRQLDEQVARALKTRALRRGVSLEEEVRSTLSASVVAKRDAFRRRAAALRAATKSRRRKGTDSVRLIRKERDASG
jgi:plasmid stability protein